MRSSRFYRKVEGIVWAILLAIVMTLAYGAAISVWDFRVAPSAQRASHH
jgi:ABC-type polysaccharide/polyol phosphate export permease